MSAALLFSAMLAPFAAVGGLLLGPQDLRFGPAWAARLLVAGSLLSFAAALTGAALPDPVRDRLSPQTRGEGATGVSDFDFEFGR